MPERSDLVYLCDGSFEGVLCCVYESYVHKETPFDVLDGGEATLFPSRSVETVEAHARRVWKSIERLGGETADWVRDGYLSCVEGRARMLLRFVRLAYRFGPRVTEMLAEPAVSEVFRAVRFQRNEAHLHLELLRFSEYGGALAAVIEPKCMVLPHLAEHFEHRFPEEQFMIYDKTHREAVFYRPYESVIRPVDELLLPAPDERERAFRGLWRRYYETIGIEGRYNPVCRMGHMKKRYWKHMLEMEGENLRIRGKTPEDLRAEEARGTPRAEDLAGYAGRPSRLPEL